MDLLKEEKRLTEKKHKALENFQKKQRYLEAATTSFRKAKREFRLANIRLRAIRQSIKTTIKNFDIPEKAVKEIEPSEPETAEKSKDE